MDGTSATTSDAFNAIAEPQRREILLRLRRGESAVGELAHRMGDDPAAGVEASAGPSRVRIVHVRSDGKQRLVQAGSVGGCCR